MNARWWALLIRFDIPAPSAFFCKHSVGLPCWRMALPGKANKRLERARKGDDEGIRDDSETSDDNNASPSLSLPSFLTRMLAPASPLFPLCKRGGKLRGKSYALT